MKKISKLSSLLLGFSLLAGGLAVGGHNAIKEAKAAEEYEKAEGTAINWVPIEQPSDINTTDPFLIGYKMDNGTRYFSTNKITSSALVVDSNFSNANVIRFEENVGGNGYLVKLSTSKYLTNSSSTSCSPSGGSGWIVNDYLYLVNLDNSNRILGRASKDAGANLKAYAANNVPASNPPAIIYKYDSSKVQIDVDGVSLDVSEKTIKVGESFDLTATVSPEGATDDSVSWTSSNEEIATVTDGHVEALAIGETTITVTTTDGEFTATCKVTVEKNPYSYDTLTKASLNLGSGYTKYTNKKLISSAEYFLYVTTNGNNIQSNKNTDAAKHYGIVTTKTGGLAKSVTVTFADSNSNPYEIYGSNVPYTDPDNLYSADTKGTLIEKITESKTVEITGDYQYLGFYSPSGANYIAEIKVKWDPVKPTSIEADDSLELTIGGTETIAYELVNEDFVVSETDVEFSSDNSAVSVSETGVVTGVSAGTANVTIKSKADENVTKTIAVTVSATKTPVTSVTLDKSELVIKETHIEELVATVLPEEASIKTVTWSSSDEEVATVDQDGKVTGVKAGTATIKVESTDDDTKYAECVVTVEEREQLSFELVTSESMLTPGAEYIFVSSHTVSEETKYYAMIHYETGTILGIQEISKPESSMVVEAKEDILSSVYVLGGESGKWTFANGEKYLFASGTSSSKNQLKEGPTLDDKAKWSIEFGKESVATINANASDGNKLLCFNYNAGNPRFACYAATSTTIHSPQLYRLIPQEGTAEAYALAFLDQTGAVCLGSDDHETGLKTIWSDFSEMYNGLGSDEKAKILAEEPSSLIGSMLERYDYIVAKYSLENFISGHEVSPLNNSVYYVGKQNNDSAVTIIAIVSVVSVTCLGVLVTLKKRKTITK